MSGTRSSASGSGSSGGKRAATAGAGGGSGNGGEAGRKKGPRWRRILQRLLITGIVGVLLLCAVFFFAYERTTIPDPNAAYQAQTSYIYYSNGKATIGSFASQNRQSITYGQIPQTMQHAIVAAEDRTFWTNKGIDPKGILRAAFSDAQGNATQGASTITQQYVKLLYLNQQRTLSRKIKEVFLSLKIQQQQSKQEILTGYLNTVYFGHGAYGVQAAARQYFNLDAKDLNVAQAAMLSSIVNSPNYLDPTGSKAERQALLARYDYVLAGMVKLQTLDQATASKLGTHLPKVVKQTISDQYGGQRGFALTMVKAQLLKLGFSEQQIDGGGLRVTTTLTRPGMHAAEQGVLAQRPQGLPALHVGVASINVQTGGLIGFYAGQDFLKSELNYATRAAGSVGSSFKPFALAAALKQGFSLKNTFDGDSPYTFPDGTTVHNEGEAAGQAAGNSYGPHINLIYALQQSVNTAFVDLTASMHNGPTAIRNMALAMGIPSTDDVQANSRIALGSASIAPVDMANAYATIANGGVEHPWYLVSKVTDPNGKVLWKHNATSTRAMSSDIATDVSYAMQQVVQGGTGTNAKALGRPAGGKTGTATNPLNLVDSSWFVGFTPQVSTAVMYIRGTGHESLEGYLSPYYGANYPTQTWTAVMQGIMTGMPVEQFALPVYVSGKPPTSGHAPYTPPPPPPKTHKPKPSKQPSPTLTPSPTSTPTLTPPPSPTGSPTSTCSPSPVQNC